MKWFLPHRFHSIRFRSPDPLHIYIYIIIALATVLFTYFGANFLIPGLRSYA